VRACSQGARAARVDEAAFRQIQRDRAEAAAIGGDRGVGESAQGIIGGGLRPGGHAVERPADLDAGAGEVEVNGTMVDGNCDLDGDAAVEVGLLTGLAGSSRVRAGT
jgi:hypothetical protein